MENVIEYSLYELHAVRPLSPLATKLKRQGALLRINGGIASLQPFPELGDEPLKAQLEKLSQGHKTPLIEQAFMCAKVDRASRLESRSAFEGLTIPKSHFLLSDFLRFSQEELRAVVADCVEKKFDKIKVKGGRDLEAEVRQLEKLAWSCEGSDIKIRVDFGEQLTHSSFEAFLQRLSNNVSSRLDYIEDPFPYEGKLWAANAKTRKVRLMKDRDSTLNTEGFEGYVVKPAAQSPAPYQFSASINRKKLVFTSYMDHPIGQYYAAYQAALAAKQNPGMVEDCGLMTQHLFQTNMFFEMLRCDGSQLLAPEGTGLGFDRGLASIEWKSFR